MAAPLTPPLTPTPTPMRNKWLAQQESLARLKALKMANGTWATLSDDPLPPGSAAITIPFSKASAAPPAPSKSATAVPPSPTPPSPTPPSPTPPDRHSPEYWPWVLQKNAWEAAEETRQFPNGYKD